jgi:hypothetical protein
MKTNMSQSNDTPKPTALEDHRPLADSELDAVSGGLIPGLAAIAPEMIANGISAGLNEALSGVGYPRGK